MLEINFNQRANVKLTSLGLQIWKDTGNDVINPATQEGAIRTELWHLMHVFGPHLYNGCDMPFQGAGIKLESL